MRVGLTGVKQKPLSQRVIYDLEFLDSEDDPGPLSFKAHSAEQVLATFHPYTDSVEDVIEVIDPNDEERINFWIRPNGEIHSRADIFVNDQDFGFVLKSPNGDYHRITVANDGTLSTEAI